MPLQRRAARILLLLSAFAVAGYSLTAIPACANLTPPSGSAASIPSASAESSSTPRAHGIQRSSAGLPASPAIPEESPLLAGHAGAGQLGPGASPELEAAVQVARRQRRNGNPQASLHGLRQLAAGGQSSAGLLLELAQAEMAAGEVTSAHGTLHRLLALNPDGQLRARAMFLLATADLALGNWEEVLDRVDVASAPDGLADLVVLTRAEAAEAMGNPHGAKGELSRPELRQSTNRLILERAGDLARRVAAPGLAGELYARGASYPGWTAQRSWLMEAAGDAFAEAGRHEEAVEQYRSLIETYTWTKAAERALDGLELLGGATSYHRGLVALNTLGYAEALAELGQAATDATYGPAVARLLGQIEERLAWVAANEDGTPGAFRLFQSQYPGGSYASEARFREGFAHYQAGGLQEALDVWNQALPGASGDEAARLHFWSGKVLAQLGRSGESQARLHAAAETRPAGYYALRASDLLAGIVGWPVGGARLNDSEDAGWREAERVEVERWLSEWAGQGGAWSAATEARARRGFGLLALGYEAEAAAEFNGLIAESEDGWFLYRLAEMLARQELWSSASRAATRLVTLSPARSITEAPPAVWRLAYPPAFADLVSLETERRGIDPLLLLALIRQESGFDPYAISIAEARGLTQVIPSTGRGIAAALGWHDFAPRDLYQPAIAVEFGAWYLAEQLSLFGGDPFQALAAYNAGAGPIPRWAADDPDLFVEQIDYSETRSYVRQVYLHHAIYRALAGR